MKIGMLLETTYPPDARIDNEASFLISQGHEVHLFNLNYKGLPAREDIRQMKIYRYPASKLVYKLSALAYDWPFYHQLIQKQIAKFIDESGIEVLHVHDMVMAKAVIAVNKKYKLPLILDLHEDRPEIMKYYKHVQAFPGKWLINLKKWELAQDNLIKQVDKVVVVTKYAKDKILTKDLKPANQIYVAPNIVNTDIFLTHPIDEQLLNEMRGSYNVLYLGDTATRRGTDTAIEAVVILKDKIPELKLWIIGKSSEDHLLHKLASELQVNKQVVFKGWQDLSLFPTFISGADVCISPLKRNKHHDTTYANKIFQYMALGKALVVSDCIAQAEVVKKAQCGLIHEAANASSLADCIYSLYQDKEKAKQMGESGKRALANEFDYSTSMHELAALYSNLK
jgi:glycosyltransferase involved in cell wall biosynthesis